jgi:hypothetical protein
MARKIKWLNGGWVDEPNEPEPEPEPKPEPRKPDEPKSRAYFAHSMRIYGTPEALLVRQAIERLLPDHEVFDPELIDWKRLAAKMGQDAVFEKVIRFCTRVVVYEYKGHIGRGVFEEVSRAQTNNRPIHVIRRVGHEMVLIPVKGWARAPGDDWRVRYGTLLVDRNKLTVRPPL